jgi:hypothetical protein
MTPEQVAAQLRKHLDAARKAAEAALYQGGSIIMTEAKKRAPLDVGTLRNSGYVTLPQRAGDEVFVEVGFGGAAKAYAVKQHEELSYHHEIGEAKYLENAINVKEEEIRAHIKRVSDAALSSGRDVDRGPRVHPPVPT